LSSAAREVLPLRETRTELRSILNIPDANLVIKCTLFEDNMGAEELAKIQKNRSRTKHIAVKYHHFREAVANGILNIVRVDTTNQLADIFTKTLTRLPLEYLRLIIMEWTAMLSHSNLDAVTFDAIRKESVGP